VTAHLNLEFDYDDDYICNMNYLLRECGSATLFANSTQGDHPTQSIQFKAFSNQTYLVYVSLLILGNGTVNEDGEVITDVFNFDTLNLELGI